MDIVFYFYRMKNLLSVQQCTYSLHFGMVKRWYVLCYVVSNHNKNVKCYQMKSTHTHTPLKENENQIRK